MSEPSPPRPRLRTWLSLGLAVFTVGSLWAVAGAWLDVQRNGYLGAGMRVAAAHMFAARYFTGLEAMAVPGFLFLALTVAAARVVGRPVNALIHGAALASGLFALNAALAAWINHALARSLASFQLAVHQMPESARAATEDLLRETMAPFSDPQTMLNFLIVNPLGRIVFLTVEASLIFLLWRGFVRRARRRSPARFPTPDRGRSAWARVPLWSAASLWLAAPLVVPVVIALALSRTTVAGAERRPNVILISIDTLRADHLGTYGYARNTSPAIDQLASEGLVFEHALSQSSWTLPSHASMLTALYPIEHKTNYVQGLRLADGTQTLAELLLDAGYQTFAVVSTPFVGPAYGLDQGFEHFSLHMRARADGLVAEALSDLRGRDRRPFFLFLHIMDPHDPYDPHGPYRAAFLKPEQVATADGNVQTVVQKNGGKLPTPEQLAMLMSLYDGEIKFTDHALEQLFDELRRQQLLDSTVVVLTADHGESFGENKIMLHGSALYSQQIHVPLILRYPPRIRPGREPSLVEASVRVMPTVLDLTGVRPPLDIAHPSLLAPPTAGSPAFFENSFGLLPMYGVVDHGYKLIAKLAGDRLDFSDAQLYDTRTDWPDAHNLFRQAPADAGVVGLGGELEAYLERRNGGRAGGAVKLDPEQIRMLRALGYLN